MRPPAFDPHRLLAWPPAGAEAMRAALRWASQHTGLPTIVVAAIAVVVSWRLFKRSARLAVEVVVAVALLLVATRLGWIVW
jgi:hypothetical protein